MENHSASSDRARKREQEEAEPVSDKILTIPNIISMVRLCLVPVFLVLLNDGHDILATFLFALAA
ncbi:MAG: CDP-alcohol phosphatidyltransferase family protein, partial [Raoultibacter sp.]